MQQNNVAIETNNERNNKRYNMFGSCIPKINKTILLKYLNI